MPTYRRPWRQVRVGACGMAATRITRPKSCLASSTVKRHVHNISAKPEVKKRTHAVSKVRQLGLISCISLLVLNWHLNFGFMTLAAQALCHELRK